MTSDEQVIAVLRKTLGELSEIVYGDPERGILGLGAKYDLALEKIIELTGETNRLHKLLAKAKEKF